MSISNPSKLMQKTSKNLLEVLGRIRVTLNLSHFHWSEILELTKSQYNKIYSGTKHIPLHSVLEISERYNLSLELIMENKVDYFAVAAFASGNLNYIHDKYKISAHSRNRTAIILLDYLERRRGWRARADVLRSFQLSEQAFSDSDGNINILFYDELMTYVSNRFHFQKETFWEMGIHSIVFNKNTPLGREFSRVKNPSMIYERMFGDLLILYEKNCNYKITTLSDTQCVVECYSKADVAEALKLKNLGNPSICNWKAGIFMSAPGYLNLPFASAKEVACVHEDSACCRFIIEFEPAFYQHQLNVKQHGAKYLD